MLTNNQTEFSGVEIAIIGVGIGGLATAIALRNRTFSKRQAVYD